MADNNKIFTTGISTTVQADYQVSDLAPNNYLTIIWKNKDGEQFNSLDINDEEAVQFTNDLNNAIEQGINNNNVSYVGSNKYVNVESIAKYLAQNAIPTSPKRTVVNGLIGLLTGSEKNLSTSTVNLMVNMFGQVADKTASAFGFSDPHEIFASLANENVIPFLDEFGNQTSDFLQNCISKFTGKKGTSLTSKTSEDSKKYAGLILGLTTSDTETYEITIPRKKVEDGSDYTTHILPQAYKKDFTVILTNKVLSSDYSKTKEIENIEKVKDKLIEIAQSRILFDVYIRLSNDKCYKRSNVYFSSISFAKDEGSGNGYTCSFTIEPITSFKTKTFISNRKYFPTPSKTESSGYGYGSGSKYTSGYGNGGNSQGNNSKNTTSGQPILVGNLSYNMTDKNGNIRHARFKSVKEANIFAKKNNMRLLRKSPPNRFGVEYFFAKNDDLGVVTDYYNRRALALKKDSSWTGAKNGVRMLKTDRRIEKDGSIYFIKGSYYVLP